MDPLLFLLIAPGVVFGIIILFLVLDRHRNTKVKQKISENIKVIKIKLSSDITRKVAELIDNVNLAPSHANNVKQYELWYYIGSIITKLGHTGNYKVSINTNKATNYFLELIYQHEEESNSTCSVEYDTVNEPNCSVEYDTVNEI